METCFLSTFCFHLNFGLMGISRGLEAKPDAHVSYKQPQNAPRDWFDKNVFFLQYLFCPLLIFRFAPQQDNVQSMSFALRWSSAWSFFSTSSSSSTTQGGHFSRLWFSFQMFAQLSPTFRPLFKTLGNAVSNAFIWFPSRKTPGNCHSCLSSVGEFVEIVNLPCRGCN